MCWCVRLEVVRGYLVLLASSTFDLWTHQVCGSETLCMCESGRKSSLRRSQKKLSQTKDSIHCG